MSKRKKYENSFKKLDKGMNKSYKTLVRDIEDIQEEIFYVDKKAKKRARKKSHGDYNLYLKYYNNDKERIKVRKKHLKKMKKDKTIDNMEVTLKDVAPTINLIARLIAAVILSILSVDFIKNTISKETLDKFTNAYNLAMAVNI